MAKISASLERMPNWMLTFSLITITENRFAKATVRKIFLCFVHRDIIISHSVWPYRNKMYNGVKWLTDKNWPCQRNLQRQHTLQMHCQNLFITWFINNLCHNFIASKATIPSYIVFFFQIEINRTIHSHAPPYLTPQYWKL